MSADPDLRINDRMKAEVLQIVREGLSNICRHTQAQQGQLQHARDYSLYYDRLWRGSPG